MDIFRIGGLSTPVARSSVELFCVTPWLECPPLTVDLDRRIEQRYLSWGPDVLAKGHDLLTAVLEPIPPAVRFMADFVRLRTSNRFQAEAEAIARATDVDWRSIIVANIAYDLAMTVIGCSTSALATREGPILVRNMDWRNSGPVARATYEVQTIQNGRVLQRSASFPGCVGVVTGMSSRGFALALNAIKGFRGLGKTGYPVLLHLRRVLDDAESYDHAVEMLSFQRLAAPAIFTIVGTENHQRLIIERTKLDFAHRRVTGNQPLYTTNHFNKLPKPVIENPGQLFKTSFRRFDGLCTLLGDQPTGDRIYSDEELLEVLTHEQILQDITAQHVIMRPSLDRMGLYVPRHFIEQAARPEPAGANLL